MAIFAKKKGGKKKSNSLPDLPELPNLATNSDIDYENTQISIPYSTNPDNEIKDLPSFPDSDFGDSLNQEAVKSAIEPSGKRLTVDISEPDFENINYEKAPVNPLTQQVGDKSKKEKGKEPVYIRIDKFKFAIDCFENIKEKIAEVEKYLQKIREQKRREEEELDEWEKEIEAIKMKVESVDNKIFSKL